MVKPLLIASDLRKEMELHAAKLSALLSAGQGEGVLVASNSNIFYLSGRFFRGYIYVPAVGNPLFFPIRPTDFAPADDMVYVRKPEQIPGMLAERGIGIPARLGLEYDSLTYSDVERLRKAIPSAQFFNASPLLREARMTKTPWEISQMKIDGLHQAAAYHRIPRLYKSDMTDLEFQIEIERTLRLEGSLGRVRTAGNLMEINMGSVINGDNADVPSPYEFSMGGAGTDPSLPGGADGSIMHNGTTVMVDMNGGFNGYQTDLTRVWRIGDIPGLASRAHRCACTILREMEQMGRPGVEICRLYERAEAIAAEQDLSAYFMGHRQKAGFIGHGVGIELNEQPAITARCRVKLAEGMTLAIEPKFVIPGVGAVGPENTYVVTTSGLECITPFPEEIQNLI